MAYNTSGTVPYNSDQQVVSGLVPAVDSTEYLVFADSSVTPLATNQYDIAHLNNSVYITITDPTLSTVTSFLVKRRTDLQNLRNTFYPGTNIRSQDLNTNYTQALNASQEVYDNYLDAERGVLQGTLDANNQRITNIATPELGGDIVNKSYADSILPNIQAINTEVEGYRDETEQFRDTAEAAKDFIQGKYLGSHASAPVDSNGDYINPNTNTVLSATDNGAFYFNTTSDKVFIWEDGHPEGGWVVGIDPPIIPFTQNTENSFGSYDVDDIPPYQSGNAWPEYEISAANYPSLSFPAGADKAIVLIDGIPVPSGAIIFEGLTLRLNLWDGNSNPTPPSGINNFLLQSAYDTQGRVKFTSPMPTALRDAIVGSVSTPINLTIIAFGEAVFGAAGWNAANYSNGVVSLTSYSNPELNIVTEDLRPQITNGTTTTTSTLSNASVTYTQVAGTNSYVASFVLPYAAPNGFSIDSTSYEPTITFTDGTSVTASFSMEPSYISGISFDSSYQPTFSIRKHDGSIYTISPNISLRGAAATLDIDTSVDIGDTPAVTNNPGSTAGARDIRLTLPRTWHISTSDPSSSDGVDGQMAYNSTTAVVFGPKTNGSWGTGYQLNGWFISNGVPSANDGIDGQMAFDYANYAYYGPKSGGSWGSASYISVDPDIGVLAGIASDIQTLADIEDGTNATNAIQTVAGISSNVSTVATNSTDVSNVAGISSDITTIGGSSSAASTLRTNIAAVAADATDIGTVAGIATEIANVNSKTTEIGILGADTTAGSTLRTDIGTVAGKTTEITNVSNVDAEVAVVGNTTSTGTTLRNNIATVASNTTDISTVAGVSSNVTSVANNNTNVTTVAGQISPTNNIATVAGKATQITNVSGVATEVGILGANTTAGSNLRSDIQGVSAISTDVQAVGNITSDVTAVAGQISPTNNISTVAGKATEITTVAGKATEITNVSNLNSEIAILGDTSSTGTTLRSNIATVAGNNTNVSTVAGISSNVTTVANNNSNINTVVGQITPTNNISTVAGKTTEITTVAGQISPTNHIGTVAGISSDITTVAGQISPTNNISAIASLNTDITTVAGQISPTNNIGTVAGKATEITNVSGVATEVGVLGAAGASQLRTDISTIGGDATLQTNIGTVAGISSNVTTVAGISSDVTTVANDGTDIGTVAGISADVTTVAGISADVSTVASNVTDVNRYSDEYTISTSAPTSPTEGDLWFDEINNVLKVYNSTAWFPVSAGGGTGTMYSYNWTLFNTSTYDQPMLTITDLNNNYNWYVGTILSGRQDITANTTTTNYSSLPFTPTKGYSISSSTPSGTWSSTGQASSYRNVEIDITWSPDYPEVIANKTNLAAKYWTEKYDHQAGLYSGAAGVEYIAFNLGQPSLFNSNAANAGTMLWNKADVAYQSFSGASSVTNQVVYYRLWCTPGNEHYHQTVALKLESNQTFLLDADSESLEQSQITELITGNTADRFTDAANSTSWSTVSATVNTPSSGLDPNTNKTIKWINGAPSITPNGDWHYFHFWIDKDLEPFAAYLGSHS